MLSRMDDYPIHQSPLPVSHPATSDRNHYDRYFFNGYMPDGEVFFGAAMGLYPNRQVIDAAFSVIHRGVQRSVFASGLAPLEPSSTAVGPLRVEVLEPMRTLRVLVEDNDTDLAADLTFTARTEAVEERRQTRAAQNRTVMDVTRFTQSGHWSGWLRSDGRLVELDPAVARGTRDRSWGVRPVGEPPGGAPSSEPPQVFWLWAPVHFPSRCTYIALFGDAEGDLWYQHCLIAPATDARGLTGAKGDRSPEAMRGVELEIAWEPGTRRSSSATIVLQDAAGSQHRLELEPLLTFQMCGLGYMHPVWSHGVWHGDLATGSDSWKLAEVDASAPQNIHIQQLCRARLDGEEGYGVLEQLVVGPHRPSGLEGILDPYRGQPEKSQP